MTPRIRRHELAQHLGVTVRTLDRWTQTGVFGVKLRCQKFGRTVSYSWSDVEAFRKMVAAKRG